MPGQEFYNEEDADKILQRAARESIVSGEMTRDRLVAAAAELGISEDALDRAERALAREHEEQERRKVEAAEWAEFNAHSRRALLGSLGSWMSTSVVLLGINFLTSGTINWALWPVGIWGLVELSHLIQAIMSPHTKQERFERWRRKRARRDQRDS